MSRVMLADDSPHALRMGEFILREEGFEIVSVTDGATALIRLADVDPDLVLADVGLPLRNGYDLCRSIKNLVGHRHVKVVLTAGAQVKFDDEQAGQAGADGCLHKPFEASTMTEMVKRLVAEAAESRRAAPSPEQVAAVAMEEAGASLQVGFPGAEVAGRKAEEAVAEAQVVVEKGDAADSDAAAAVTVEPLPVAVLQEVVPQGVIRIPSADPELVRAAVTLALESALPVLIDEITQRVTLALDEGEAESLRI